MQDVLEVEIPAFVVCQDCMKTAPYSQAKHLGKEKCQCGGEFCGCINCMIEAIKYTAATIN